MTQRASRSAHAPRRRPKVALVHDWLTGMRGGEKVLEAICELYPDAPIYTLRARAGLGVAGASSGTGSARSFVQRLPRPARHYRQLPAALSRRRSSSSTSTATTW